MSLEDTMLWKEVKTWAKSKGYETLKDKDDNQYYWAKLDDPDASGVAKSVSKLATAIYNHMTNNKWLDHQKEYRENLELKKANISDY
jgi:hypothetical protein